MILVFVCTTLEPGRSNGSIVATRISRVKFVARSVTMISLSSGQWENDVRRAKANRRSSGSEDNWFYIWKTEPDGPDEAFSPSSRKRRDNFDRAFERIQGKAKNDFPEEFFFSSFFPTFCSSQQYGDISDLRA